VALKQSIPLRGSQESKQQAPNQQLTIIADVRNIPLKTSEKSEEKPAIKILVLSGVWSSPKKNLTSFQSKKSHLTNPRLDKQITLNIKQILNP